MLLAEATFNLNQSAGGLKTTDGPAFLARHNEEKTVEAKMKSRCVGLIEERDGSSGKWGGCRENLSCSHSSASLCADLQCHKHCPYGVWRNISHHIRHCHSARAPLLPCEALAFRKTPASERGGPLLTSGILSLRTKSSSPYQCHTVIYNEFEVVQLTAPCVYFKDRITSVSGV
jgi:hypothetical protein